MPKCKIAVTYCLHEDHWFLDASIRSWQAAGDVVVFLSDTAWDGSTGDVGRCRAICDSLGVRIEEGTWTSEADHRHAVLDWAKSNKYTHILIPDSDEVISSILLDHLVRTAKADLADRAYVHWDTYWKSSGYVIRPRERFTPLELIKIDAVSHVHLRHFEGGRGLLLGPDYGLVHHLSYAGPDERIARKIATWGHREEVVPGWFDRIWHAWSHNHSLRNLHPTHPEAYGFAERIAVPKELSSLAKVPSRETLRAATRSQSVSIIIPLHGGEAAIRACLESLKGCQDCISEVIVVDNASPDNSCTIAASFDFVKVIKLEANRGFAAACNVGLRESTGELVVFLNSDTVVTRAGLNALLDSLLASGSIGAVGPYTNESGHAQRIETTYTSLETVELFAEDFAGRKALDIDAPTDMLVGFCLAVRKSVLNEVGLFDESFGIGTFEDNDLCYRIRRAGYRLVIASKSFIHHEGSSTFRRVVPEPWKILEKNQKVFVDKWREDLESGYASHLAGLGVSRIVFNPDRSPEQRRAAVAGLAEQASISLCMIVRDEERVLKDCLKSAAPFFTQVVIVDTGSKDKTIEIAKDSGAEAYEMVWPDSFSGARNESLKHATGKWVFWMDADDTLPFSCGEQLLLAALNAPKDIAAFVVPVQFVDEGPGGGTRVDHVKLFRNGLGIHFEGRIHEQNLPSISAAGGKVARSSAYVLHSGYDVSTEGQAKKRVRDEKLLKLDLDERPGHPFVLFNLGMTAHYTGGHKEAISWLEQSLNAASPKESHVRKAYALIAGSQRALGLDGEALSTLLKGLNAVGEDPELHFQAGILLTELKQYEEARKHYELVSNDGEDHFSSVDVAIFGHKLSHNLGAVCHLMGDYESAKKEWIKALEISPSFLPSAFALFDAACEASDISTARLMVDHVEKQSGQGEDFASMAAKLGELVGGPNNAEQILAGLSNRNPTSPGIKIVFVRHLLNGNREAEALPLLHELNESGIAEAAFFLGIICVRQGEIAQAIEWMERSLILNPSHDQTIRELEKLRTIQELGPSENQIKF